MSTNLNMYDSCSNAVQKASNFVCAELKASFANQPNVSKLTISNETEHGRLEFKLSFYYCGNVKVHVKADRSGFRYDTARQIWESSADLVFEGSHMTVGSLMSAIQLKYVELLKDSLMSIQLDYDQSKSRRVRLFENQQLLIDAGFDVEVKVLSNDTYRLIVKHEHIKSQCLKELNIV